MSEHNDETMETRMAVIENTVNGNGREGLCTKVERHDKTISEVSGMIKIIKFIGLSNIITFFAIIYVAIKGMSG